MSRSIRWSQWCNTGMVGHGFMTAREIMAEFLKFEKAAKDLLVETGADHVLYGVKKYSDDGKLLEARFYLEPMDDHRFQRDVAAVRNVVVYALHRGTNGGNPYPPRLARKTVGV